MAIKIPWLLNEDASLKYKLQGLQVFDANAPQGRNVPVRFRLPEVEVADLTMPIIVIDHDGWYPAPEREHRGFVKFPYAPEGFDPWWDDSVENPVFNPNDGSYWGYFPIPFNLDYTVTLYARIQHEHTMPLIAQLMQYKRLHPKFGFLDVPQDGTKRTLQLLGGPAFLAEYDSNGKRIFKSIFKIRVFSELIPEVVQYVRAKQINLDVSVYLDIKDLTGLELKEARGLLSVGTPLAWDVETPLK